MTPQSREKLLARRPATADNLSFFSCDEMRKTLKDGNRPQHRNQSNALKAQIDEIVNGTRASAADVSDLVSQESGIQSFPIPKTRRKLSDLNACFSEIIRQVSISCKERGEALEAVQGRVTALFEPLFGKIESLSACAHQLQSEKQKLVHELEESKLQATKSNRDREERLLHHIMHLEQVGTATKNRSYENLHTHEFSMCVS